MSSYLIFLASKWILVNNNFAVHRRTGLFQGNKCYFKIAMYFVFLLLFFCDDTYDPKRFIVNGGLATVPSISCTELYMYFDGSTIPH